MESKVCIELSYDVGQTNSKQLVRLYHDGNCRDPLCIFYGRHGTMHRRMHDEQQTYALKLSSDGEFKPSWP